MASETTPSNRFTSQGSTAQDLLASQTVGLVHLSDFRKRRADALEQKEREAGNFGRFTPGQSAGPSSGAATPNGHSDGATTPTERPKKKRKPMTKGKLSFGIDDDEDVAENTHSKAPSTKQTPESTNPTTPAARTSPPPPPPSSKPRLGPNSAVSIAPRALTKAALLVESQTRDVLRRDFLAMQETVRATEIVIPFVFYDGTNIPGGSCKIKKGDHIWLFLDRARKLGAQSGVNAAGERGGGSRREWARVGVDDLVFVRGEVIIPHHYDIYHFLVNKVLGPNSERLFNYQETPTTTTTSSSSTMTTTDKAPLLASSNPAGGGGGDDYNPLSSSTKPLTTKSTALKLKSGQVTPADAHLEGVGDDPNLTKVVDRRWYERNKHIFPASVWEEYDTGKVYEGKTRTDKRGTAFFFT